ncbi:zinc-binding dehydrogenase [bacterium]|nr:zinc-binding dehydrogenase [bacterium]
MKSRVMVLESFRQPLVLREVEIPPLDRGEILVRLLASGVCGSDVHMWNGKDSRIPLPVVLGHEGIGTITDMNGAKLTVNGLPLVAGDRIIWNRGLTCGKCWYCAVLREPSLCTGRHVYGITFSFSEKPYLNGCYADYIVLRPQTDIFKVPDTVDPAALVPAACSGATMAHAFDMIRESLLGRTVVVQGPGPLGIFAVAFARSLGASQIIVIGGSAHRLSLCGDFGATSLLNRGETTADERRAVVMDSTWGRGADYVVEAAGAAGVAEEGIKLLRKGGTYLTAGYSQPAGTESIDFYRDIVRNNIRIQGIWVSDTGHVRRALDLVLSRPDLFARLVTHRFALEQANEALSVMEKREAVKAVIVP